MRFSLRKVVQLVFVFSLVLLVTSLYVAFVDLEASSDALSVHPQNGGGKSGPIIVKNRQIQDKNIRKISSVGDRELQNKVPSRRGEGSREKIHRDSESELEKSVENPELKQTELSDIFISVKTTQPYHTRRLDILLETWHVLARDETYFFTDAEDEVYKQKTRGHLINTNCSSVHTRKALCCKMSVEFDTYIASNKRWFCHVDDDTYVNIPALLRLLKTRNHSEDWYLGRPSLSHALEITDIEDREKKLSFWFATGGAGFCISRGLALKMVPFTGGGKLKTVCSKIRLPDDCTIGYIIYHHLKKELTVIKEFHSHLEGLWRIKHSDLSDQITMSYKFPKGGTDTNIVHLKGFPVEDDPTRFRSIHCFLYPYFKGCPQS